MIERKSLIGTEVYRKFGESGYDKFRRIFLPVEPATASTGKEASGRFLNAGEVAETHGFTEPTQCHSANGAVTVLGHNQVSLARTVFRVVGSGAVQEHDHVGVLLDRAALAQVCKARTFVFAQFDAAVELRQRDNRKVQFLGQ